MSAIADDHRLLRVHLHVGVLKCFENTLVAVPQVVGKVRSGSNQDHIIHILPNFDMPACTLEGADQKGMQEVDS
eukprot:3243916-Amphidinium_carterae.1